MIIASHATGNLSFWKGSAYVMRSRGMSQGCLQGVFSAMRHRTPEGSSSTKSRILHGLCSGGRIRTPYFSAIERAWISVHHATGLGRVGYRIDSRDTQPLYHARIVVEAFGTTQGLTFFGMPPVQSVIIPFSLPALRLYKAEGQKGYTRLHIDFFEYQSGKLVGSSPTIIGRTYYNQYTLLFFVTWQTTDLLATP